MEEAELYIEVKSVEDLLKCVTAHRFFTQYSEIQMNSLKGKYQVMESIYHRIGSYKKFDEENPKSMVDRFIKLKP